MRRSHYLSQNHTSHASKHYIFVDTEALNQHGKAESGYQKLWFGCAWYIELDPRRKPVEDKCFFRRADEFWDWVETHTRDRRPIWIMAHNWNYDGGVLHTETELLQRGWECRTYINGKPPLIISWKHGRKTLKMVDTLNYFTSSLEQLGAATGLKKLDSDSLNQGEDKAIEYCWRDVEIIKEAFLSFRKFVIDNDLGTLQSTLASQAFTAFRHRFMKHEILAHDDADALELERESYHGGRTEAFYNGSPGERVYKLDINSMYPALMREHSYSARLIAYWPSYKPLSWQKAIDESHGLVARCLIETSEPCYGVVRDSKLIFPTGRFTTTLSTPEIHYALEHGHIKEIYQWAEYEREPLFTEFVDFFYTERMNYRAAGNEAFTYMCKILMNSLYGKFGQNGRKWTDTDEYYTTSKQEYWVEDADTGEVLKLRNRLGQTQKLEQDGESENSCPIVAAEITAYARMLLCEYIRKAGNENVYYVDTDSLVVNQAGFENLSSYVDETVLGMLKQEKIKDFQGQKVDYAESSNFKGPKDYQLEGEWKIKGVRQSALVWSDMQTRTRYAAQPQFTSWDKHLSNGEDGYILVKDIVKALSGRNTKRRILGEGWTLPIELWE